MSVAPLLAFVCSSLALAADPPPPPIVGGEPTSDYPAVGALVADLPSGWGGDFFFCSGTLISPDWVLTAGHCAQAMADYDQKGVPGFHFFMGTNVDSGAGELDSVDVEEWYVHPDYDPSTLDHDLGLVHLVSDVTAVDPMAVNTDVVTGSWEGREITYVGFGVVSDNQKGGGVKRSVAVDIAEVNGQDIITWDPGANVCQGDSGGAMLYPLADDAGFEVLGANSFVFSETGNNPCTTGGGAAARVDNDLDWITSHTPINASLESDADTDADADTDTDTDADADTDSDADTDTADTGVASGGALPTPSDEGGGTCSSRGSGTGAAWAGLLAFGALLRRRRR